MAESDERRNFIRLTEDLLEGVVVMYSNLFRTSKAMKCILDAMDGVEVFGNNEAVLGAFKAAWDSRNELCKLYISIPLSTVKTRYPDNRIDDQLERNPFPNRQKEILKAYIIAREAEVFQKRSRTIGPQQKQKYGRKVQRFQTTHA